MKRNVKHYTDEFKYRVVKEYLDTDLSQREVHEKYGLNGCAYIPRWIRKFGLDTNRDKQIHIQTMKNDEPKTPKERQLEAKIKELEASLEHERLRTLALNTLIDIAERDLKVPIRKKPGAKQ